jgi:hypothetical protein
MNGLSAMATGEAESLRRALHRQERSGPRRWRAQAFQSYAVYVYSEHVRPFEAWFTDSAICERMNRLQIPAYRGDGLWTTDKLRGIRQALPRHVADLVDKGRRATVS